MRCVYLAFVLLAVLPIDAGAKDPEVLQLSPDTYMITRSSKAGMFANMSKLKSKVIKQANEFAAQEGRVLVLISERSDRPTPGFPWYEITFRLVEPVATISGPHPSTEAGAIETYFADRELDLIEGIWTWDDNTYQIAIIKNNTGIESEYDFVGIIIRADYGRWKPGQVKILLNSTASDTVFTGVYFDGNQSRINLSYILKNPNLIDINYTFDDGSAFLIRDYPVGRTSGVAKRAIPNQATTVYGTCFAVSDAEVLTSQHVVASASQITVEFRDGIEKGAVVLEQSQSTDLALLKISGETPSFLPLASMRSLEVGQEVFTVGFPVTSILGSDAKFTEGSVSALSGIQGDASYFQMSVPIQPGNSGGPVVNMQGEVVGVVTSTAAIEAFYTMSGSLPQNVNWASKSDYARLLFDAPSVEKRAKDRSDAIEMVYSAICKVKAVRN